MLCAFDIVCAFAIVYLITLALFFRVAVQCAKHKKKTSCKVSLPIHMLTTNHETHLASVLQISHDLGEFQSFYSVW